jgi:hypothetical protein
MEKIFVIEGKRVLVKGKEMVRACNGLALAGMLTMANVKQAKATIDAGTQKSSERAWDRGWSTVKGKLDIAKLPVDAVIHKTANGIRVAMMPASGRISTQERIDRIKAKYPDGKDNSTKVETFKADLEI